jgi:hypothetical protein
MINTPDQTSETMLLLSVLAPVIKLLSIELDVVEPEIQSELNWLPYKDASVVINNPISDTEAFAVSMYLDKVSDHNNMVGEDGSLLEPNQDISFIHKTMLSQMEQQNIPRDPTSDPLARVMKDVSLVVFKLRAVYADIVNGNLDFFDKYAKTHPIAQLICDPGVNLSLMFRRNSEYRAYFEFTIMPLKN